LVSNIVEITIIGLKRETPVGTELFEDVSLKLRPILIGLFKEN
jgi:hypothetical protein